MLNSDIFEQALAEDDDYIRLQKITEGIRLVANAIMKIKYFNNSELIKYMICAYPFSKDAIQILLDTVFEYFSDKQFLDSLEIALIEIGQLKEFRTFLSSRSQTIKVNVFQQHLNKTLILSEQAKQGVKGFSKQVIEKVIIAKQFAITFIERYLKLAKKFHQNLEEKSQIIKQYILNTKSEVLIINLISLFDKLQQNLFKNHEWINQFDEELEIYCFQQNIKIPKYIEKRRILEEQKRLESIASLDPPSDSEKSFKQQQQKQSQSQIDDDEYLQIWLATNKSLKIDDTYKEQILKEDNIQLLIEFILYPQKEEIDNSFYQQFKEDMNQQNIKTNYYNKQNTKIEFLQILRSYQTSRVFTNKSNLKKIYSTNPQFFHLFYKQLKSSFEDEQINFNLNHVILNLDSFLQCFPKINLLQIFEQKILFHLLYYIENPQVLGFLIDMHSSFTITNQKQFLSKGGYKGGSFTKFQLDISCLEIFWKYQLCSDWFLQFENILLGKQLNKKYLENNYKFDNQYEIIQEINDIQFLKDQQQEIQKNYVKQKLTNILGSLKDGKNNLLQKNDEDFKNWKLNYKIKEYLTLDDITSRDIDNLIQFSNQRDSNYLNKIIQQEQQKQEIKFVLRTKSPQSNINYIKYSGYNQTSTTTTNQIQNNSSNRSIKLPSIHQNSGKHINDNKSQINNNVSRFPSSLEHFESNSKLTSQLTTPRITNKVLVSSQRRIKTDIQQEDIINNKNYFSYDGFSSSKLIMIYPSKCNVNKLKIENIFEQMNYNQVQCCLTFMHEILISFFEFYLLPNKSNLQAFNESIIIQKILNLEFLNYIYNNYLQGIIINQQPNYYQLSQISGNIINLILKKSHDIEIFQILREQLKTIFFSKIDQLSQTIIQLNKQIREQKQNISLSQSMLIATYFYGFNLFTRQNDQNEKQNIFKYVNETIIHIFIIWFFDSSQNNYYQNKFIKFLAVLFAKAPQQTISNVIFSIGLVNSSYNAFQTYYINGIKSEQFNPNIYSYLKIIVYIINTTLQERKFIDLSNLLKSLESWKCIYNLIPNENIPFIKSLKTLVLTGQSNIKKTDQKRFIFKLKTQLTTDFDNESTIKEISNFEQQQNQLKIIPSQPIIQHQDNKKGKQIVKKRTRKTIAII